MDYGGGVEVNYGSSFPPMKNTDFVVSVAMATTFHTYAANTVKRLHFSKQDVQSASLKFAEKISNFHRHQEICDTITQMP